MDNCSDTVLTKKIAGRLKIVCRFGRSGSHVHNKNYTIQCRITWGKDGDKQYFVGQMLAKLQAVFNLRTCSKRHGKEMKIKNFNLTKKGNFPCKLQLLGPSEQEFHGE